MDSQTIPLSLSPFIPFIVASLVVGMVVALVAWIVRGHLREKRHNSDRASGH